MGAQGCTVRDRLPQATCHGLCHLLGLGSCRWLRCLMQGALSLDEALRRPLDLCPICLRKLQHVLGFKLLDRYKVSPALGGAGGLQQVGRMRVCDLRGTQACAVSSGGLVGLAAPWPRAGGCHHRLLGGGGAHSFDSPGTPNPSRFSPRTDGRA